jgi:hypothetical protein
MCSSASGIFIEKREGEPYRIGGGLAFAEAGLAEEFLAVPETAAIELPAAGEGYNERNPLEKGAYSVKKYAYIAKKCVNITGKYAYIVRNASISPRKTHILLENAHISSRNASISPRSAHIVPGNASIVERLTHGGAGCAQRGGGVSSTTGRRLVRGQGAGCAPVQEALRK